jgi:tetratricopeptide (TPR) repeat protein
MDNKDYDKALSYYAKIDEKSLEADDYTKIGILYSKKKSFPDAYKNFNKAISMDSVNTGNIYFELGSAQFDNNEYENCIATFDKALDRGLKQFPVYLYQGISYFYLKKYDDAIAKLQESIKLNDQFAFTYLWVGKSYVGLLKKDDAIKAYNKCLELDPTNEEALKDLKSIQTMNFEAPPPNPNNK